MRPCVLLFCLALRVSTHISSLDLFACVCACAHTSNCTLCCLLFQVDEDMESQNIIVAVRVRPPNDREKAFGSECTISMDGPHTIIGGPDKEHKFKFDHSFWSMNEKDPHFADQEHVFQHMGVPLLHRAFEGYNCCLFAYGQTGALEILRCVACVTAFGTVDGVGVGVSVRVSVSVGVGVGVGVGVQVWVWVDCAAWATRRIQIVESPASDSHSR
jgi:hypothetical protein